MADHMMLLRPYGPGYSVVETDRTDTAMMNKRIPLVPGSLSGVYNTDVSHDDFCASVSEWFFDSPASGPLEIYFTKNLLSGFWDLNWGCTVPTGLLGYIRVLFIARGFCSETDMV